MSWSASRTSGNSSASTLTHHECFVAKSVIAGNLMVEFVIAEHIMLSPSSLSPPLSPPLSPSLSPPSLSPPSLSPPSLSTLSLSTSC